MNDFEYRRRLHEKNYDTFSKEDVLQMLKRELGKEIHKETGDFQEKFRRVSLFHSAIHHVAKDKFAPPKTYTLERLFTAIKIVFGLSPKQLKQRSRKLELVEARAYFCRYARDYLQLTTRQIGDILGRDYSTVIHASTEGYEKFVHWGGNRLHETFMTIEA